MLRVALVTSDLLYAFETLVREDWKSLEVGSDDLGEADTDDTIVNLFTNHSNGHRVGVHGECEAGANGERGVESL